MTFCLIKDGEFYRVQSIQRGNTGKLDHLTLDPFSLTLAIDYSQFFCDNLLTECRSVTRAVASLTVPGGQAFHFPHCFLKFRSIFPQTLLISFLILAGSGWASCPPFENAATHVTWVKLCFPSQKLLLHIRRFILRSEDFISYCGPTTALPLAMFLLSFPECNVLWSS